MTVVPGRHRDRISLSGVRSLLAEFRKADYFSFRSTYVFNSIHGAGAFTSITLDGRTQAVDEFRGYLAGAPDALELLENTIDRIAKSDKWVNGNAETVRSLEAEGWNSQTESPENDYCFLNSFERGPKEMIDFLLRQPHLSPEHEACALGAAAARGDVELFQRIAQLGSNPADPSCHLKGGVTALMRAMESGQPEIVRMILAHHPDVNLKGTNEETALMTFLLRTSGTPQPARLSGEERQEEQRRQTIVDLLLRAGADVNVRDQIGRTPFFCACYQPETIFKKLVKAGADINARDGYGRAPVMTCNNLDGLKRLIALGPDLQVRDWKGLTALAQARQDGNWRKAAILQRTSRVLPTPSRRMRREH